MENKKRKVYNLSKSFITALIVLYVISYVENEKRYVKKIIGNILYHNKNMLIVMELSPCGEKHPRIVINVLNLDYQKKIIPKYMFRKKT